MKKTMSNRDCLHEEEVLAALHDDDLPERMKLHASQCEKCGEVVKVAQGMVKIAHEEIRNNASDTLPDAVMLWRRAQFFQPAGGNTVKSIEWIQFLGEMAVPLGLAMWITMNWFAIETVAQQMLVNAWPETAVVSYSVASLAPAALVIGALALAYPTIAAD